MSREQEDKNLNSHTLFKTGDPKAPDIIKDRNGEVVLGLCTRCGAGESELYEADCLTRLLRRSAEQVAAMSPLEKALMFARQRRSWVVGEMMLGDDGKEGLPRERAMALYEGLPEGALLAELERRMVGDAPAIGERAKHYGDGVQPWDHIKLSGWGPEFAAGNALKYVRRYLNKNGEDDLQKGRWYYHELVTMVAEAQEANDSEQNTDYDHAGEVMAKLELLLTQEERLILRAKP